MITHNVKHVLWTIFSWKLKIVKGGHLNFKLSPCSECCMLSSGYFSGVGILFADVLEHCPIFLGGWVRRMTGFENVGVFILEKVWLEDNLSQ